MPQKKHDQPLDRKDQVRQDAGAAARILSEPLIQRFFEDIRAEAFAAFRKTGASAAERREELHGLVRMADMFEARLKAYITNGRVEKRKDVKSESLDKIETQFGPRGRRLAGG